MDLDSHRVALTGHCYRMLGSVTDADDAVQETLLRALRAADGFDGRSSVRTWLYRIATNVCLDALQHKSRRERPMGLGPSGTTESKLETRERSHWIEPIPDTAALPSDGAIRRETIRLAFIAALQQLPPKQRAALLLVDVLDFSAVEAAEALETTTASINSALQRARAAMASSKQEAPGPLTAEQQELLREYVAAFESYDAERLAALCKQDVTFSMPPYDLWLQGPDNVRGWLNGPGHGCRGSIIVPVPGGSACDSPAFAQYRNGGAQPWALVVLELDGNRIAGWNSFLDVETLFPRFGLPLRKK